ncbi:hypothetical protein, conserved [Leishmania tarentolae]|uniref:J domain-containing protein n=1 Tax=Leishmania tarentolae TaxID=5689 RepID=A0A640KKJ2_LEITA|nr:hypothetical protein, conserved [Leishmania tarentolae]
MQLPTPNSLHGASSSGNITALAALHDPAVATDEEIVECVLLIWRDVSAAAASCHAPTHTAVMHRAALRIFGRDSLQSAAALRCRYRQLAVRVHPDKNTSSQASEAFQLLQGCFECLASSREAEGIGDVGSSEQGAFQCTGDSRSPKGNTLRRRTEANGEDAQPSVSPTTSSSFTSSAASSSSLSPPLSPVFSTGDSSSSSSSRRSSLTQPRTAAYPIAGRASPPQPPLPSHCSAQAAVSMSRGVFLSAAVPEPPDVFATSGGATPTAPVSGRKVFDEGCSDLAVPPPRFFNAHPTFKAGPTGAVPPEVRCRAPADGCTSFSGTLSDLGPAPPLVLEQASCRSTDASAGRRIDGRPRMAKQHSKQQRSTRKPGLPTLAELLAGLDADDDDGESGSETILECTRNVPARESSKGSAVRLYTTYETTTSKFLPLPTRLWSSTAHPIATHPRGSTGDSADCESSETPVAHCASMTTDPARLEMPCAVPVSRAPSSTPSTLAAFYNALQEEVRDTKYYHTSSASPLSSISSRPLAESSVRSRRAGSGGMGGSSKGATPGWGSSGSVGERCACGKAPRGRCFLCEE